MYHHTVTQMLTSTFKHIYAHRPFEITLFTLYLDYSYCAMRFEIKSQSIFITEQTTSSIFVPSHLSPVIYST